MKSLQMFIFCVPTLDDNDSSNRMEVWPPQSPDLDPIEQVWAILGGKPSKVWRKCYRRSGHFFSVLVLLRAGTQNYS